MEKYHRVFASRDSENIGFACRAINFLEDVVEDAECSDVYVSMERLEEGELAIEPVGCKHDVEESVEIFGEQHGVGSVLLSRGGVSLRSLYDYVIDKYRESLHHIMLSLALRTLSTGYEYYLGVLFDGKCFVVEGERERVVIPRIPHCISAHTHPASYPCPSSRDMDEIASMFAERGVGHVIVSRSASLAIYRVEPITVEVLEHLKSVRNLSCEDLISSLAESKFIRVRYI